MTARLPIAIIGTGFSGLGMAIRLKRAGIHDFAILERAADIGGTWRDNTYPGCRCDVPSHLYSFSFALNPEWSNTYSFQPEIWDYLRDIAAREGIAEHIRFGHEVQGARWDDETQCWQISTAAGPLSADVLIAGTGGLSAPALPALPGLDSFTGTTFHSAAWNHEHVLDGERVAVIGTGASAIQLVPHVQRRAGRLAVFQRTPPWVMPHTGRRTTRFERALYRRVPFLQRLVRAGIYWTHEALVLGLAHNRRFLVPLEQIGRRHLRRQVPDRDLRRKLKPRYRVGCKRILIANDYYPALTQPNVDVVTDPIEEVTARGIRTSDGREHELDTIIFATGFQVTDSPTTRRVTGRDGRTLAEVAAGSPRAYLGTTFAGFPNLFVLTGPNTGLAHNSLVFMIESQINYVADALAAMRRNGAGAIEVRPEVQAAFNEDVQRRMRGTVWTEGGCQSWYLDATGRNTTLWPGFTFDYRRRTRRFDEEHYIVHPSVPAPVPLAA